MRIERKFTKEGQDAYSDLEFVTTSSEIRNPDGTVVFQLDNVEVPTSWSQVASDIIAQKTTAALAQNLDVMLCVGETKAERDDKKAEQVVIDQLQASIPKHAPPTCLMIAYEPVWAIGTGAVASPDDIAAMHNMIASLLAERFGADHVPPILYGGSVNADNAASLFSIPQVSGALVGGASLDAEAFAAICAAAQDAA